MNSGSAYKECMLVQEDTYIDQLKIMASGPIARLLYANQTLHVVVELYIAEERGKGGYCWFAIGHNRSISGLSRKAMRGYGGGDVLQQNQEIFFHELFPLYEVVF